MSLSPPVGPDAIARLDRLIAEVRAQRSEFRVRADAVSGVFDRRGLEIDAAACAIREMAFLEARRAIVGRADPGSEVRIRVGR